MLLLTTDCYLPLLTDTSFLYSFRLLPLLTDTSFLYSFRLLLLYKWLLTFYSFWLLLRFFLLLYLPFLVFCSLQYLFRSDNLLTTPCFHFIPAFTFLSLYSYCFLLSLFRLFALFDKFLLACPKLSISERNNKVFLCSNRLPFFFPIQTLKAHKRAFVLRFLIIFVARATACVLT